MNFVVRSVSNPESVASEMRGVLREVDTNLPVHISSMADLIGIRTAEPGFQVRLLGIFAVLALILAAIGTYGVLAYAVTERTHEIGIRMALGASTGNVIGAVIRNSLALAGAGVVLGTAGALAVTRVLAKFLFDVKPTDSETFVAVALLLTVVALCAAWIPARRATRVDPAVALRVE
jgi:putative ABC transport system permease protein